MNQPSLATIRYGRAAPGIPVRDIDAAHRFYSGILGFTKTFENGDPVGFMILKKDQAEIHLNLKRDHRASTITLVHMLVDDVDALHAICVAEGVRIIKSIADKDYGLRAFVFADPDGNRIDVGQPYDHQDKKERGTMAERRFEHQNMAGAEFRDCNLAGSTFDDVNLSESLFSNVNLRGTRFTDVNMAGVTIDDANIEGLTIFGYDIHALIDAEMARKKGG